MFLHNVMEDLVTAQVDGIIKNVGCCDCEICRMDVIAFALNLLPVRYVVTERGALFSKAQEMNFQLSTDVIAAITTGILMVKDRPRH